MQPKMTGKQTIYIDVISDIICPFCFIGKRKLEEAITRTSDRYSFVIRWEPFLLRPNIPDEGIPLPAGKIVMPPNIVSAGETVGIQFTRHARIIPNTITAHTLLDYARDLDTHGTDIQNQLQEKLFHALFVDGLSLTLDEVVAIAKDAGLDHRAARAFIQNEENRDRVRTAAKHWALTGVSGVPTFYMNGRMVFSGAQDADVFVDTFRWAAEKHPHGRLDRPKM